MKVEIVDGIWNEQRYDKSNPLFNAFLLKFLEGSLPGKDVSLMNMEWKILPLSIEWEKTAIRLLKDYDIAELPFIIVYDDHDHILQKSYFPVDSAALHNKIDFKEDERFRRALDAYNELNLSVAAEL
jgi:hypothetical protein